MFVGGLSMVNTLHSLQFGGKALPIAGSKMYSEYCMWLGPVKYVATSVYSRNFVV